jgi:hypothetical protein
MDSMENGPNEHSREVYARFGLAFYYAQVLEHGIVDALVLLDLVPNRHHQARSTDEWTNMFDQFIVERLEKTMGRLIRELRLVAPISVDFEALLRDALLRRNGLAHDFFREYSEASMTEVGRRRMIDHVDECRAVFVEADRRLEAIVTPVRRAAGITDEMVVEAVAEMRAAAERAG